MLNARINGQKIWYALFSEVSDVVDENGDYTGEKRKTYEAPRMTRANLSAYRGTVHDDIFGVNLAYSRTMSTAKMNLGIDERTILWEKEPVPDSTGEIDPLTADYRVVAVARGHYHVHYALRKLRTGEE